MMRRFALKAWWVVCALWLVGCMHSTPPTTTPSDAGAADAGTASACAGSTPRSFDELYAQYFDQKQPTGCSASGCHGTGAGGLTFTDARSMWEATVGKSIAADPNTLLVVAEDPAHSFLLQKLAPGAPDRMPQGGPYLDDNALAAVRGWICAGAPAPTAMTTDAGTPDAGTDDAGTDAGTAGPTILSVQPISGVVGTSVTIAGTGFSTDPREVQVSFNGLAAPIAMVSETTIATFVPTEATTGPLTVTVRGVLVSAGTFQVIQPNPVPTLASVTPTSVDVGSPDLSLTLSGSQFVALSTVELDGTMVPTQFQDASTLKATLSASLLKTAGNHTLTVTTPGPGGGTSAGVAFAVNNPAPTIISLSPTSALAGVSTFSVTLTGQGFVSDSHVTVNGADVAVNFLSATQLSILLPASTLATAGNVALAVVNAAPGGGTSAPATFTVKNPPPGLGSVSPTSVLAGSSATTLTLSGANFVSNAQVLLDSTALTTTFVSATQLTAAVDSGSLAIAGTHQVTVMNPAPGGGTSMSIPFVVQNPIPAVTQLSPSSALVGSSGLTLTLTGSNFEPSSTVAFAGSPVSSSYVSATQLTATIPASALSTSGSFAVTVTTPAPGGGTSTAVLFTVQNPSPSLTSLSPATVVAGSASLTMTVNGSAFVTGATVLFDGASLPTTFVSATQLSATVGSSLLTTAGAHLITVQNPTPGGGTSSALTFVVQNPVPTLSIISPSPLTADSTNTTVTITGSNFVAGSQVSVNGTSVTTQTTSSSQLVATVPGSLLTAAGTLSFMVTNPTPGGGASAPATLTVVNPVPGIVSVMPSSVTAGSGSVLLDVTGTGFVSGTQLQLDGANLTTTLVSATDVTATVDASLTAVGGTHSLTLKNPTPGGGTSPAVTFTVNNPSPTLTAISPSTVGTNGATFTLTLSGTNFNTSSQVNFNGSAVTTAYVSSTSLTAQIPTIASAGNYSVKVTNPAPGGGTSGSQTLTASSANVPVITGLSPTQALANTAFTLTVSGSGYACSNPASVVLFAGTTLTPSSCSSTQLVVSVPAEAAGTYAVQVKNQGQTSNTVNYDVVAPNPVPTLTSVSPSSAVAGDALFTLTANGSNFVSGSTIQFNGNARTTTFISSTQLTATIPASDIAAPGTFPVTVVNPTPGGGTSSSVPFNVVAPNPIPTLSSLSPSSVGAGAGAVTVTINGTSFVSGAVASFNGSARTTHFVSASQVTVDLTSSDTQTAGSATLAVTNPAPGGGTSGNLTFTIAALNPVPTLTSLSPNTAAAGGAGFTLTVNGSNFVSGATVSFNGVAEMTTFVSSTQLTASVTSADLATAGSYPLIVTNPAPGGGTSNSLMFTVATPNPVPTLSTLSPSSVNTGSGATTITLTGTGFVSTSSVTFNGSARTTHFTSSTQLSVDLTATDTQSAGSYLIAVTNPAPGGGTSGSLSLTVVAQNPVPVLSSLSPSSAAVGGSAFTLTVSGTGFVSGSTVLFNGASRTTTFVSSAQLTANILSSDIASAGTATVTVTSPSPGGGTSNGLTFSIVTQNPVPSISSLSPSSAAAGSSGTNVTITGSGFVSSSSATFNGSARTTSFVSSTQLTIALAASDLATAGSYPITVVNPSPGGGTSGSFTFTVVAQNPVPVLSSLSPTSALAGSGSVTLTANGSSFVSGSNIVFNGVAKTTTFVSASQLTATLSSSDVATAGTYTVTVNSPTPGGGTSGSLNFTVTNPSPTISSLSPSTITVGTGAQSLSVNGTNFVTSSVVQLDGSARTTHFVNSTLITADLLASDVSATGTHTITVVNPTPGGGTSAGATLTASSAPNPTPTISSLSPCGTVAGSGSFTLTINGSNFVSGATATFNGTAVTLTVSSASKATASIPGTLITTAPSGNVANVVVTNPSPGGGASNTAGFGVASKTSTLSGNVQTVFTASCATSACHSGSMPSESLNLSSGQAYANLVGVPCQECAARNRVLSCAPQSTQSYLIAKITGSNLCSGSQMPKGAPLTAAQQQVIIDWVAQGTPQ